MSGFPVISAPHRTLVSKQTVSQMLFIFLPPASERWGRYCFQRCLSVYTWGVPHIHHIISPSHITSTGPRSLLRWYPGVPLPPLSRLGPRSGWGYTFTRTGWGTPIRNGWVPPVITGWGYPPSWLDGGTPVRTAHPVAGGGGDRAVERVLATRLAVCLLHSLGPDCSGTPFFPIFP